MSSKQRLLELNARLAQNLTDKGVQATADETTTALINKVADIPSGGGDSYYDAFWDAYQENGERTDYANAFKCLVGTKAENYKKHNYWTKETLKPKYSMKPINASYMFHSFGESLDLEEHLINCGITLDLSSSTSVQFAFGNAYFSTIPELDFSNSTISLDRVFYNSEVVTIRKMKVNTNVIFYSTFYGCDELENIVFEGEIGSNINFVNSPKLTTASVDSIINALVDLTGQTSQTLTLHSTVLAKITDEQHNTILSKNWTYE
jgi:hypothetical protein